MPSFQEMITLRLLPDLPASPVRPEEFRKWILAVWDHMEYARLLIILDGFDQIIHYEGFTIDFLNMLRHLAGDGHLAWVTSSFQELGVINQRICGGTNHLSDFTNMFKDPIYLGCFSQKDISAYLHSVLASGNIPFTSADAEMLANIAGPWPFILERAIQAWLETRQGNTSDHGPEDVWDRLLPPTTGENNVFQLVWSSL